MAAEINSRDFDFTLSPIVVTTISVLNVLDQFDRRIIAVKVIRNATETDMAFFN